MWENLQLPFLGKLFSMISNKSILLSCWYILLQIESIGNVTLKKVCTVNNLKKDYSFNNFLHIDREMLFEEEGLLDISMYTLKNGIDNLTDN